MTQKLDLNKLKDEIDSRKKQKNLPQSMLGESVGTGIAPRDLFLNGLLESLRTGKETAASSLVKTVDNKATERSGGKPKLPVQQVQQRNAPVQPQRLNEVESSPERDEELYRDLESKRKQTIAESMSQYIGAPRVGTPMTNQPQQTTMNEGYLVENVKKVVDNYLLENFTPIVEEAIKSTILEMYAVERIKEVLHENKDLVKTIVYETIRELQAKSKAKAQ